MGRPEGNRTGLVVDQEVAVVLAVDLLRDDGDAVGVRHDHRAGSSGDPVCARAGPNPDIVRLVEIVAVRVPAATVTEAVHHPAGFLGIGCPAADGNAETQGKQGEQVAYVHAVYAE